MRDTIRAMASREAPSPSASASTCTLAVPRGDSLPWNRCQRAWSKMSSRRLQAVLGHVVAAPGGSSGSSAAAAAAAASGGSSVELPAPMTFVRGPPMKNRFMLAPLTNEQSGADGVLSDDEYNWLVKRAEGGFGLTMTCASHVQRIGQGFSGQLGCWSDDHLEGLTRLAAGINKHDSVSVVQLHHAGIRSPPNLIGEAPVGPSDDEDTGSRALSTAEVEQLVEDFIVGAQRCEAAGFDGVELHGAHEYILCQFLSADRNRRTDQYGGSAENRERIVREIITGIRARCRPDFNVGIRLSPERFGIKLGMHSLSTLFHFSLLCRRVS
jgi:2,4-dienoyl-CoA reductase-like NADH-dependent reductase (Old Yellow Enzyme family)